MPRIRVTVAYVGTRYHGWQVQKNGTSIQGVLEERLARICASPIRVHGSGRTDAGVHALGQVAHFDVPDHARAIPWQKALNALLPADIAILSATTVQEDFHARFSAISKRYCYTLWTEPDYVLPHRAPFVWPARGIDLEQMDAAARLLCGTHDFSSFQNAGTEVRHAVRTIFSISRAPGHYPGEWVFSFHADGFVKQMVRNIMGLLVQVGQCKLNVQDARRIRDAHDRTQAPPTAPGQGLCLEEVHYQGGCYGTE
ncbi:tRNA pseudouridine synthase A [Desulfovibrionales bacterium]